MKKEKNYYVLKDIYWYTTPDADLEYKREPFVMPFIYNKDRTKIKFLATKGSTNATIIDLDIYGIDALEKLNKLTNTIKGSIISADKVLGACNLPFHGMSIKVSGKEILKITKIFFKRYKKRLKTKSIEAISKETRDF